MSFLSFVPADWPELFDDITCLLLRRRVVFIFRHNVVAARFVVYLSDCGGLPLLFTINLDANRLIWLEHLTVTYTMMLVVIFRICLLVVLVLLANHTGITAFLAEDLMRE